MNHFKVAVRIAESLPTFASGPITLVGPFVEIYKRLRDDNHGTVEVEFRINGVMPPETTEEDTIFELDYEIDDLNMEAADPSVGYGGDMEVIAHPAALNGYTLSLEDRKSIEKSSTWEDVLKSIENSLWDDYRSGSGRFEPNVPDYDPHYDLSSRCVWVTVFCSFFCTYSPTLSRTGTPPRF